MSDAYLPGSELLDRINWPDEIDESVFLKKYWQKKPLLIRQAFIGFETPLPADELAGLSLEPDVNARLILKDANANFHVENGPFDEDRFSSLTDNNWSLLVTDVEKHLPELSRYLTPFRFIPDWRIDDLMISYAPDGASVGAHVDEYDVFLLQASGVRTWHIDSRDSTVHELLKTGDLKILASFSPDHSWDLNPGDMLYLPPNMAHHGIAKGDDCMTWSVGFRAPLLNDMLTQMAELIANDLPQQRYNDGTLLPATRGEIDASSVARFKSLWLEQVQLSDAKFAEILGRWLTEPNALAPDDNVFASDHDEVLALDAWKTGKAPLSLQKSAFSRYAWQQTEPDQVRLFVDGESFVCTRKFALALCSDLTHIELLPELVDEADLNVLQSLINRRCISFD